MAIFNGILTYGSPPANPVLGDKYIVQVGDSYQAYTWLRDWIPYLGGGNIISESNLDDYRFRIIVQEDKPTISQIKLKPGDVWVQESILQEHLYIWEWVFITGA